MDSTSLSYDDIEKANPDIFNIWIPEDKPFDAAGRYTVALPGSMNENETMEVEVRDDGGFTILDHISNDVKDMKDEKNVTDTTSVKKESFTITKMKSMFANIKK